MPQPAPAPPDDFFELLRQASHKEITAEASEAALAKMLGAGANPNKIDSGGWSVLLTCCSCSTLTHWVPRLIAAGADPNFQSAPRQFDRSHNPLALAFGSNKRSLARFLISHGADPAKSVREGISVECAGVVTRNYNPISVALIAAWLGDAPLLARALASGDDPDLADQSHGLPRTPLNLAALHRDPACLRLLLEHGADPNSRADQGAGPLHMAAKAGLAGNIELLLRAGADIQAGSGKALHMAVEGGHAECVLLLGKAGADLESLDSERRTPAQLAVLSSRKAGGPAWRLSSRWGSTSTPPSPTGTPWPCSPRKRWNRNGRARWRWPAPTSARWTTPARR